MARSLLKGTPWTVLVWCFCSRKLRLEIVGEVPIISCTGVLLIALKDEGAAAGRQIRHTHLDFWASKLNLGFAFPNP